MTCIETPKMSIIWNGEQLEEFKPQRGIRQDDLISPYIFVLCMETLGHIINQSVLKGEWKPIKISRLGQSLSHLFFADDLILFAEASEHQMSVVLE